ncbi:MAG: acetyl-CoA carboxylase biotin carboxyl carrier protein subunit [Bacteroidales bacterium]|jgi:biotin carboxyl carrier protein|nr:acetyl-CoA carboxylase biotin carboxyl carrier protein subunit [Bacteroidales bacterium]
MKTEININGRTALVELLQREGNHVKIRVDEEILELDLARVGDGVYSALLNDKSYNIEMVNTNSKRHYTVSTFYNTYNIEIIDPQTKYLKSREGAIDEAGGDSIVSPMPGRVIKILVKEKEQVQAGQTVMTISAMKMESEFKAPRDAVVKKINVNEGDVVDGNQVMMVFE